MDPEQTFGSFKILIIKSSRIFLKDVSLVTPLFSVLDLKPSENLHSKLVLQVMGPEQ